MQICIGNKQTGKTQNQCIEYKMCIYFYICMYALQYSISLWSLHCIFLIKNLMFLMARMQPRTSPYTICSSSLLFCRLFQLSEICGWYCFWCHHVVPTYQFPSAWYTWDQSMLCVDVMKGLGMGIVLSSVDGLAMDAWCVLVTRETCSAQWLPSDYPIIADARSITTEKAAVICDRLIWSTIRIVVMSPVALMASPMVSLSFNVYESGVIEAQCS